MRRILSLPGLTAAVWLSYLTLMALLAGMVAMMARHPHFLPVTAMLILVVGSGLALVVVGSWRVVRGPGRFRALSWLLIGAAPMWFLGGHSLFGLAAGARRVFPLTPAMKLLFPLGESLMDLEARFRYPMRTVGEEVVMISAPMPEAEARAQVAAMDRHVRAVEARLGRPTRGKIHWVRGPLLWQEGKALVGLCMASRPGALPVDAEGLSYLDRHEVAHCIITDQCTMAFGAPAVLSEGWAQANQDDDPVEQAVGVWEAVEKGDGLSLRQLVGPGWYERHEWPVYQHGAPLVHFLLRRFGPGTFLELYTTCRPSTFEDDCRRILGLDLDGLDAAFHADLERVATRDGPIALRRLKQIRLAPGVDAGAWKAFLADYFAAADRLLAPYHHVRLAVVWTRSATDARGHAEEDRYEQTLLRSGEFASLRWRFSGPEEAVLAHPRRSIRARRETPAGPWKVRDDSKRTPTQARRLALDRIDDGDATGRWALAPLTGLGEHFGRLVSSNHFCIETLERFSEDGRPRVRIRIEDHAPRGWQAPWRALTLVLAADDLYAPQSQRAEGTGPGNKETAQSRYTYDRHEGIPVLRSERTETVGPDGAHGTMELKVVDRRFGPIPEEEFDPGHFLDGPRVIEARPATSPAGDSMWTRFVWLPLSIGALGLIAGVAMALRSLPVEEGTAATRGS